jgi:hypothetical protein
LVSIAPATLNRSFIIEPISMALCAVIRSGGHRL